MVGERPTDRATSDKLQATLANFGGNNLGAMMVDSH